MNGLAYMVSSLMRAAPVLIYFFAAALGAGVTEMARASV
jgi:hypothetical protein